MVDDRGWKKEERRKEMTQQDIIEMVKNPAEIKPRWIPELSEFLREYPYSQTFRMLYLKALKNAGDFRYESEKSHVSAYILDRAVLADLMDREPLHHSEEEKQKKSGVNQSEEKSQAVPKNNVAVSPITDIMAELEQMQPVAVQPKKKSSSRRQGMIDSFLEESKGKSVEIKVKQEPESQIVEDRTEGQGNEQFYTETLAKIYVKQKKYDQAVKIFKRLMTKNSEKSVYFAAQVRFFERLMENL